MIQVMIALVVGLLTPMLLIATLSKKPKENEVND